MKPASPKDIDPVERYVRARRFRNPSTRRVYRCVLGGFQRFVFEHTGNGQPTTALVQRWLVDRSRHWPLHIVCHRATTVDRFLEWMEGCGAIQSNPFTELRQNYGWCVAPIVRALASDHSAAALQKLRRPPRFGSFLGSWMQEHVERMRSLGYRYDTSERKLLRFDCFLQSHAELSGSTLRKLLDVWRESRSRPSHLLEAYEVGRLVSKAMHRVDPTVALLPGGAEVRRRVILLQRRPYIYTEAEIRRLLEVTETFMCERAPLRAHTLYTMALLTYCAGLRIGEVVRLTIGDVNWDDETIEIRGTKFFKSRRLPLAPGVIVAIRRYVAARKEAGAPNNPMSGLFWNDQYRGSYSVGGARNLLVRVLRRAELKPARGKVGPRIHDLRHAMVCNRMLAWYREGINPQSRLPYLATFLGHKNIDSTLAYLNITPDLLQEASERVRVVGARALSSAGGSR
jgi:integrase